MPEPDTFLEEQITHLETLCTEGEPTPARTRAAAILVRAHQLRRDGLLRDAPRLRRHLLHDLRSAARAVRRDTP